MKLIVQIPCYNEAATLAANESETKRLMVPIAASTPAATYRLKPGIVSSRRICGVSMVA